MSRNIKPSPVVKHTSNQKNIEYTTYERISKEVQYEKVKERFMRKPYSKGEINRNESK